MGFVTVTGGLFEGPLRSIWEVASAISVSSVAVIISA